MAFIFDLEEVDSDVDLFVDASGTSIIDFALGYDQETSTAILMSVMLVSGESYLEGTFANVRDIQFGIRVRNLVHDTISPPDFTSASASLFIPKGARVHVLVNICKALMFLLRRAKPQFLTMETYYPNLPDEALQKYDVITKWIWQLGYDAVHRFRDETSGIDYWFFAKVSDESTTALEPNEEKD